MWKIVLLFCIIATVPVFGKTQQLLLPRYPLCMLGEWACTEKRISGISFYHSLRQDSFCRSSVWRNPYVLKSPISGLPPSSLFFASQHSYPLFERGKAKLYARGHAEVVLGIRQVRTENPLLPVGENKQLNIYFDHKLDFSLSGCIGDRLALDWVYDNSRKFDVMHMLNVSYTGKSDEILRRAGVGNISPDLSGTLIKTGQDFWGVQTELQFGKLTLTSILAQQKSETKRIVLERGKEWQEFEFSALDYDADRHFFLSGYFYDFFEEALSDIPLVDHAIEITRLEVWVTNKEGRTEHARNLLAFTDIGEGAVHLFRPSFASDGGVYPDNERNLLYRELTTTYAGARDIYRAGSLFSASGQEFLLSRDYEKLENARLLRESEYIANKNLGFISLNRPLAADEVLAVAYEYTRNGERFKVGEFASEVSPSSDALFVKLLSAGRKTPDMPLWRLMMKNVYAFTPGLPEDGFVLDVVYREERTGTTTGTLPAENIKDKPLLALLGLDRLNVRSGGEPDGAFDFVEGATVCARGGYVWFPVPEPFGKYLREKIGNAADAGRYVFDELYNCTKADAAKVADRNKFYLKGKYKTSGSSGDIFLGSYQIPEGSIRVMAGERKLAEHVDYIVDYDNGILRVLDPALIESGLPLTIHTEHTDASLKRNRLLMGVQMNYALTSAWNIGATFMHMRDYLPEKKPHAGEEPLANSVWGMQVGYHAKSGLLDRWASKLLPVENKGDSRFDLDVEVARFNAAVHKKAKGNSYLDDFEESEVAIDLNTVQAWKLSAVPESEQFPEAVLNNRLAYGYNRAHLAWYIVDPLFYEHSRETPEHIRVDREQCSNHYSRGIRYREVFPERDSDREEEEWLPVLTLAFDPRERGPYNFDVEGESGISAGVNEDGVLREPDSRWGGIMRALPVYDLEAANMQYLEMWLMDPFVYQPEHRGGEWYVDVGSLSEDVLKDGRKSIESGIPTDGSATATTAWGRVPSGSVVSYSFDNRDENRRFQDVGLDGLGDADERVHFHAYLERIKECVGEGSVFYQKAFADPSGDNYHYFRGTDYDRDERSVLERYRYYNNTEGNSPTSGLSPESYATAATLIPDAEDVNGDYTLHEAESFYRYKLELSPGKMRQGENYITQVKRALVDLPNGKQEEVKWYLLRIPLQTENRKSYGNIRDLKSAGFMRFVLKGFEEAVVLRLATLELIGNSWQKYDGDPAGDDRLPGAGIELSSVNLEKHALREPVNYLMPPGTEREESDSGFDRTLENEGAIVLKMEQMQPDAGRAIYKYVNFNILKYKRLEMEVHAEALSREKPIDRELCLFIRLGSDFSNHYYEYEYPLLLTAPGMYPDTEYGRRSVWPVGNKMELELSLLQELKLRRNEVWATQTAASEVFSLSVGDLSGCEDVEKRSHVLRIRGNPTLAEVRVLMIGVRNRAADWRSVEVWLNELKLSDPGDVGGWGMDLRMGVQLGTLASLHFSGSYSTAGFGQLEQAPSEVSGEDRYATGLQFRLDAGRLFSTRRPLRIPLHYDFTFDGYLSEYDPCQTDIPVAELLKRVSGKQAKDSIKRHAGSFVKRHHLVVSDAGLLPREQKLRMLDWANVKINLTYGRERSENRGTASAFRKEIKGGVAYSYQGKPDYAEPFADVKIFSAPGLRVLREFNFALKPSVLSFHSVIRRNYDLVYPQTWANLGILPEPVVNKDFIWNREFAFRWDLCRSMSVDFKTVKSSRIDEPEGRVAGKEERKNWRDSVWHSIRRGGRPVHYTRTLALHYIFPFEKLPGLEWIVWENTYEHTYEWSAGKPANSPGRTGNTIQNHRLFRTSGNLHFSHLYAKLEQLKNQKRNESPAATYRLEVDSLNKWKPYVIKHNLKSRHLHVRLKSDGEVFREFGYRSVGRNEIRLLVREDTKAVTVTVRPNRKKRSPLGHQVVEALWGIVNGIKSLRIYYSEERQASLSGFLPESRWFGQQRYKGALAPGFSFLLGVPDESYGMQAARKGWLVSEALSAYPYQIHCSRKFYLTAHVEILKGLRVDFRAERLHTQKNSIGIVSTGSGFYESSRMRTGDFSMTMISFRQAKYKVGHSADVSVGLFRRFQEEYRKSSGEDVYRKYGEAFNRVYGCGSTRWLPTFSAIRPNWRVSYNGLLQFPFIRRYFTLFSLSHVYNCRYGIGSYFSEINRENTETRDVSEYGGMNCLSVSEEFNPLIGLEALLKQGIEFRFAILRRRDVKLYMDHMGLSETAVYEFSGGIGYRLERLLLCLKKRQFYQDIHFHCNLSVRREHTISRRMEEEINSLTGGGKVITFKFNVDYRFNDRLKMRVFYERSVNTPYLSLTFPCRVDNYGLSLKFSFQQ